MSPKRLLILFLILLLVAGGLFTEFSPPFLLSLASLWIIDLSVALLWTLAAGGLGFLLLRFLLPKDRLTAPLAIVSCFALGLGAQSLLIFTIGSAGLLRPLPIYLLASLPLAGWLLFPFKSISLPKKISPVYLIPALILILALIGNSIAIGVLWRNLGDPHPYDVFIYHFQLPREWIDLGRITPLSHNAYSYFPFNLEMHFLAAMILRNGPYEGAFTAQYIGLIHMILAALAIRATVKSKFPALVFCSIPWIFLLGTIAYNESATLLYVAMAIAWTLQEKTSLKTWLLAGAFAGLAAGTKYTAVPLLFLFWPIALVLAPNRPKPTQLALYLLTGILLFSPWMIRNILYTKNPVFPEAMTLLGKGPFTEQQQLRWEKAHAAAPSQQSASQKLLAFYNQVLADARYGYLLIPCALLCALIFRKQPHVIPLLAFLILLTLFWFFFTHLQSRFFVFACIPASLLIANAYESPKTRWIALANILIPPLCLFPTISSIKYPPISELFMSVGVTPREYIPVDSYKTPAPDGKVILIGDSRPFLYPVPSQRLVYKTIFDINLLPGETLEEAWKRTDPATPKDTLIVNPSELERLTNFYISDK